MFKRVAFVLVVCSCVGIAFGAAVKIKSFVTFAPEPLEADGMAILNYAAGQGKTIVQIIVSDFSPETTYDLVLISRDGTQRTTGFDVFTTDGNGHGTYHGSIPFDVSSRDVELYVSPDATLTEDELRAIGLNPDA